MDRQNHRQFEAPLWILIMFTLIAIAALVAPQATWYVDAGGTGPGTGTITDPYASVAFAVAQPTTLPGDTVEVGPGTYTDEEVDFLGKDVRVVSSGGALATVLVAPAYSGAGPGSSVVQFTNGETRAALLMGFTLKGGSGAGTSPFGRAGGGVYCQFAGATIRDCIFTENVAEAGGGFFSSTSSLVIEDCEFTLNLASSAAVRGDGALVLGGNVTLRRCQFHGLVDSHGTGGGALFVEGASLLAEDCAFDSNLNTRGPGSHLYGQSSTLVLRGSSFDRVPSEHAGAISVASCTLLMEDCQVRNNEALSLDGAGLAAVDSDVFIYDSVFSGNRAESIIGFASGGAIYLETGTATILDSVFDNNLSGRGGAMALESNDTIVRGCTIRDGQLSDCVGDCLGGGIYSSGGTLHMERTILADNHAWDGVNNAFGGGVFTISGVTTIDHCTFQDNEATTVSHALFGGAMTNSIVVGGATNPIANAVVNYCLVQHGLASGTGNFEGDPGFWFEDDLHLLPDSDAIDRGDPLAPSDPDGSPTDVGAFAFDPWYCPPGCSIGVGSSSCASLPNSTGVPAGLTGVGSPVVSMHRLVLNSTDVPVGALGYMLASRHSGLTFPFGSGQGILCLGGSILRFSNTILRSGTDRVMSFRAELTEFPQSTTVMAGDTWYFQTWFRDSQMGAPTSNTTHSLTINFD